MFDGCEIDGVRIRDIAGTPGPKGDKGDTGDQGTPGAQGGPSPMTVKVFDTVTLTNSPATVREILGSTAYRVKLDLTGFTQYRATMWVATQGVSAGDVHFEGSADGTNFGDLDAAATEISVYGTGSKDTGWKTIQVAYRADNVFIRMMEKDGDGVSDPIIRQVLLMFK